jgi:hypothetical protein
MVPWTLQRDYDILNLMQGLLDHPLKPAPVRPNPPGIRPVAARTAASLGGGGALIFVFLPGGSPVKYTDPDGRADEYLDDLIYRPWQDTNGPTTADWQFFRDYNDPFYSKLNDSQGISIPSAPPDVDIEANIRKAKTMKILTWVLPVFGSIIKYAWFYKMVRTDGEWDYKKDGHLEYETFGNFHYGVVGRAAGIPKWALRRAAGWANERDNNIIDPSWSHWYLKYPYGDDPRDQVQIEAGMQYYDNRKKRE